MCGIIHCKKLDFSKRARKSINKRYYAQKTRGTEGYGFIELTKGYVTKECRAQDEKGIMKLLDKSEADEILFHHRTPTSTPNFIESTHPIKVEHPSLLEHGYYIVHNGVITNDTEIKKKHNEMGFEYNTELMKQYITKGNTYNQEIMFNDSESLAIDFALSIEKKIPMEVRGSIAVIALQYNKHTLKATALYYGRNAGNPLCLENTEEMFSLSSITGKTIEPDHLYRYDYEKNEITDEEKDIGLYWGRNNWKGSETDSWNSKKSWNDRTSKVEDVKADLTPTIYLPDDIGKYEAEEDDYILTLEAERDYVKQALDKALQGEDIDRAIEHEISLFEIEKNLTAEKLKVWHS